MELKRRSIRSSRPFVSRIIRLSKYTRRRPPDSTLNRRAPRGLRGIGGRFVKMPPMDVLEALSTARATAILRTPAAESARPAMDAAIRGGFTVVEFTLTTPGVRERITEFSSRPGIVVGAGTVMDAEQARAAV